MTDLFADFALPTDTTAKCYLTHPVKKTRMSADGKDCFIELHSFHSQVAQDYRGANEERLRRLGRELTTEEQAENIRLFVATLTKSWQLVAPNGKAIKAECTFDNAKALFTNPQHDWIFTQCILFLNELGNFVPASWMN